MAEHHAIELRKVDRVSETRVRLDIEVPESEVQRHVKGSTEKFARMARIPGFRPGKAPAHMVLSRYEEEIKKDVVTHLIEAGLATAIEKAELFPINRPKIDIKQTGFNGGKSLQFEAEFEVRPAIKLGKYKGIPVKVPKAEVNKAEIDEALENLRERFATLEPVERPEAKTGDFGVVKVGFALLDGDLRTQEPREFTVEIGKGRLLPEIEKALVEMKTGERRDAVEAVFPKDYNDKTLAGRKVKFDVELVELKKKVMPELDDAFAEQVRPSTKLAELREQIEKELLDSKNEERTEAQRQQVLDFLVKNHTFEVPASMVAQRTKHLLGRVEEDLRRQGRKIDELTDQELKVLKDSSERQVKGSLLLAEIARAENISLDSDRVDSRVKMIATQLDRGPDEARKWLEGKGILAQIRDEVLTDQVFDFLLRNASLSETQPKKAG